jgi:hypothetical protein
MATNSSDVIAGTNATKDHYNNLRKDALLAVKDVTADSDGATITFNMATSPIHKVTLGGNRTLAVSNVATSQAFVIILLQDGSGSHTVTWWGSIKWPAATAPVLTTTANRYDVFSFIYDGTNYYCVGAVYNLG